MDEDERTIINRIIEDLPFPTAKSRIRKDIHLQPDLYHIYIGEALSIAWAVILDRVSKQPDEHKELIMKAQIAITNILLSAETIGLLEVHVNGFRKMYRQFACLVLYGSIKH